MSNFVPDLHSLSLYGRNSMNTLLNFSFFCSTKIKSHTGLQLLNDFWVNHFFKPLTFFKENQALRAYTTSSFSFVLCLTSRSRSLSLGWVSARFRKMTNSAVSQSVGGMQWVSLWPPACCYNTAWPPEPSSPLWACHPVLVLKHTHTYTITRKTTTHKSHWVVTEGAAVFSSYVLTLVWKAHWQESGKGSR